MRLAGRLRGRQPLQRRGVVRGRVGYGDLHAETEVEKLLLGFVNPRYVNFIGQAILTSQMSNPTTASIGTT